MATQGTSSSGSSPKNEKESVSMYMYDLYVAEFDNLLEFDEVDFFRAYQRTF